MKTSSDGDESKVIYAKFGNATSGPYALSHAAISALPEPNPLSRQSVLAHIKNTFKSMVRRSIEVAWIESADGVGAYDPARPICGPYGGFIGYYQDGMPNHFLRHHIDRLKGQRQFTRNAIELRCDALCLAVYVSGITLIDTTAPEHKAREGVRVVVYDHNNIKYTAMSSAKSPEELVSKLHNILISTYNRLAREYNLAGFTSDFLTLTSSHKAIPNIRIDMND